VKPTSRLMTAIAALAVLPAGLVACGDATSEAGTTTTARSTATSMDMGGSTGTSMDMGGSTGTSMDMVMSRQMTVSTGDGKVTFTGHVETCTNPNASTLEATVKGDTSQAVITTKDGAGTVVISGAHEFEGTADKVSIGDTGMVTISGRGSLADPGSTPTDFTITGSCI